VPELPEVETIARQLRDSFALPGRLITGVRVGWAGTIATASTELFCQRLAGQRIEAIGRRGKFITFALSGGDHLLIHLRMTGQLFVEAASPTLGPHDRVIFTLDDGRQLRFRDTRKFGQVYLVSDSQEILGRLGPEPLDDTFGADDLAKLLQGRSTMIKPLLLDQQFIAGIGNIYADEALFAAGIHPQRKANSLSMEEVRRLHAAIRQVLVAAIEHGGTTVDDYRQADGSAGWYQNELRVFRRAEEPCPRCGTTIRRIVLGGRSTHFCPVCQK
jgi:formamidopyrimidine-DNA glycosylase